LVYRRFRRWTSSGIRDVLLQALADSGGEADMLQMIDSTIVRAHHCAAGGGGDPQSASRPLAWRLLDQAPPARQCRWPAYRCRADAREAHDLTAYDDLIAERDSDPGVLLGDRGYDSDRLRQDARDRGAQPEIPTKRSRTVQHSVSKRLYALRAHTECFINRLKNCRRVATRYDHTATSFLGFALLGCIRLWIRFVHAA